MSLIFHLQFTYLQSEISKLIGHIPHKVTVYLNVISRMEIFKIIA